jgi:hypothetical protein
MSPNAQLFARRISLIVVVSAAVGAIVFLVASVPSWVNEWIINNRRGPAHVFELDPPPKFLADGVAVDKARESLALDGLNAEEWAPVEDGRTMSPEGEGDRWLCRNALNPNVGFVQFRHREQTSQRIVHMELAAGQLTTYVWLPK